METKYLELKKELLKHINPLEKKYIKLAKKFTLPNDTTYINKDKIIISQYEENKDNITFGVFIQKENDKFNVSIIIFDEDYTFSNIVSKQYNSLEQANQYYLQLEELIKNNNINDLSLKLLEELTTHNN